LISASLFLNDLVGQAVAAGAGLAFLTGSLGSFLLWRRMAFFGDALGHSALLGVALGFYLNFGMNSGVVLVCLFSALVLSKTRNRPNLSSDAWLGILSYGSLALGVLALSKSGTRIDPESYLFGDILTLARSDIYWIYGCVILVGVFLFWKWRDLLLLTLDEEIARTDGVHAGMVSTVFMVILALTVAVALKAVGALLVPALLIMPAATAGQFAKSPVHMVFLAGGIAFFAIVSGLGGSILFNVPSGATIVTACLIFFLTAQLFKR
jgi:zinc transport system permease protein